MYRLTRDDGAELQVNGGIWESALELACFYGWRPAGTETPRTPAWRGKGAATAVPAAWNRRDYFSHESQHVARDDAHALAEAVLRALGHIQAVPDDDAPETDDLSSPIPSRASAMADGISLHKRKVMNRFVEFAWRGGFTIGQAP